MSTVTLATLVAYDCWNLLETAQIARVAWYDDDGLEVVPVNYTVADGGLWFRTERTSGLAQHAGGHPVVVEVDDVDLASREGWSVVVRGTAELVDELDVPDMLVDMQVWPAGSHSVFVRVEAEQLTGRRLWGPLPSEAGA